jgi:hypothetical protein
MPKVIFPLMIVLLYTTILCYIYLKMPWSPLAVAEGIIMDPSKAKDKEDKDSDSKDGGDGEKKGGKEGKAVKWETTLLTMLGFLIGMGLNMRNQAALARYDEGRKTWAALSLSIQSLTRLMWVGIKLRPDHAKEDLLAKLTALNMVNGFCRALMHKLRFEPYADYDDLSGYIAYLPSWAKDAGIGVTTTRRRPNLIKRAGTHLGFPPLKENPRHLLKEAKKPVGNLPLEILLYLFSYIDNVIENKQVAVMGYVMQLGKSKALLLNWTNNMQSTKPTR